MWAQSTIWFFILCVPGILPAAFFYARHINRTPQGAGRFPLWLYVVVLLICAFAAFWAGVSWGVAYACSGPSWGNLCGLLGVFVVGPLGSIVTVSVASWLMTCFPLQMRWVAPIGVMLLLLGGYYYVYQFRSVSLRNTTRQGDVVGYRLQSDNLDDLRRYAPMIEAQMRELPVLRDVRLESEIKTEPAVVGVDPQKPTVPVTKELPTMTIRFSVAPNVVYGDALAQLNNLQKRLGLPATIRTSMARGE